jgi:putative hydrolase of the HAD superfamily
LLRAITLDYWDTIFVGASVPERIARRQEALLRMLATLGSPVAADTFDALYRESGAEANRWWRDEHRGYQTADRIRWILERLEIERPEDCEHIAEAVLHVDQALLDYPPPLLPGAVEALRSLSERFTLAIVSDTGFASGRAQDALLEREGIRDVFTATIYSMDIGHAKPRPEIFHAALAALGCEAAEALHVGDNERTDVAGALAIGMRAVRIDALRDSGQTKGEHVVTSLQALAGYLLAQ